MAAARAGSQAGYLKLVSKYTLDAIVDDVAEVLTALKGGPKWRDEIYALVHKDMGNEMFENILKYLKKKKLAKERKGKFRLVDDKFEF